MQDHDQEPDDKFLSELYTGLSQEQPRAELDAKILAEAREVVATGKLEQYAARKASGPFQGRWTVPVSLAAVIVLSVTVVVMIERERPYSLTSSPETPRIEPATQQSQAIQSELSQAGETQAGIEAQPAERLPKKALTADQSREESTESDRTQAAREKQMDDRPLSALAPAPVAESSATENRAAVMAKKAAPLSQTEAKTEAEKPEPAPAAAAKPSVPVQEEMAQAAVPADAVAETGANRSRQMQDLAAAPVEKKISGSQSAGSVASKAPEDAEGIAHSPAVMSPAAIEHQHPLCLQMTEQACLASTECVLQQQADSKSYQCRAVQNACERGFAQSLHNQEDCERNPQCQFIPADCYCPPGAQCVCGGGAPAMCVPKPENH
ncbi:MAG TPA: hypothetical protein VIM41_03515 [Gammaproteobacteria bacterium]